MKTYYFAGQHYHPSEAQIKWLDKMEGYYKSGILQTSDLVAILEVGQSWAYVDRMALYGGSVRRIICQWMEEAGRENAEDFDKTILSLEAQRAWMARVKTLYISARFAMGFMKSCETDAIGLGINYKSFTACRFVGLWSVGAKAKTT